MKITLKEIPIRDLIKDYANDDESGQVSAYGGRLNIRPKYQREFVYKDAQRNAVIQTILWGFPLNTMYWVRNDEAGAEFEFEVLDGQQRTISICEFAAVNFSLETMTFRANFASTIMNYETMPRDEREKFLDYKLQVYICEGEDSEKLEWFRTINIAGEKLTEQELRNAVYACAWLSDAKRRFSKRNSLAEQRGGRYLRGEALRQEHLETALAWKVGGRDAKLIEQYMNYNKTQKAKNADELWFYFNAVIDWVEAKFPKYRKEMKGLEWGLFYNAHKDKPLDADELEAEVSRLMMDDEVTSKRGIYEFVLTGAEKHLNLRAFSESQRRQVYEKQGGMCANGVLSGENLGGGCVDGVGALSGGRGLKGIKCPHEGEVLDISAMEADHIVPWSRGGKTEISNCQMLCRECNRAKSGK